MPGDDPFESLREALRLSPDNIPLRTHLAEQLLAAGRGDEAVDQFKQALAARPDDAKLKTGLAQAFHQQGKDSAAMVIVEDLVKQRDVPAKATMLYARLLLKAGDVERAVRQYKKAVEADASVADIELAGRLGISATETSSGGGDVVDGKVRTSWDDAGAGADEIAEVE